MTTPALKAGLTALRQGHLPEAIAHLNQVYQTDADAPSQDILQAQVGLIRAYRQAGDLPQAIALCHPLTTHPNPQIQAWAEQTLTALHTAAAVPRLSTAEADQLYSRGSRAFRQGHYQEAIAALTAFCHGSRPSSREYAQAQMWLVKAYQNNNQSEEALALCQTLATSGTALQIWAQRMLLTLLPAEAIAAIPALQAKKPAPEAEPAPAEVNLKSLGELKQFYRQELLPDLKRLEAQRQVTVQTNIVVGVVLSAIVVAVLGLLLGNYADLRVLFVQFDEGGSPSQRLQLFKVIVALLLSLGVFVVGLIVWVAFFTYTLEIYGKGFKEKVIQKIIRFIDTNQVLHYSAAGQNSAMLQGFNDSLLFSEKPTRLIQDDSISGRLGQTEMFFAEICAKAESTRRLSAFDTFELMPDEDSTVILFLLDLLLKAMRGVWFILSRLLRGQRIALEDFKKEIIDGDVSREIFKGLFFVADFNKRFDGKTFVLPDIAERYLGQWGKELQARNKRWGELIVLEDAEFERLFAVYGTDQVEARYILSTSLMAKLTDFKKKADRTVLASFVGDRIYLAIKSPEDLFEPKLFKSMLDFAPVKEYFETLQLMIGIVEELHLNRRIWTKR